MHLVSKRASGLHKTLPDYRMHGSTPDGHHHHDARKDRSTCRHTLYQNGCCFTGKLNVTGPAFKKSLCQCDACRYLVNTHLLYSQRTIPFDIFLIALVSSFCACALNAKAQSTTSKMIRIDCFLFIGMHIGYEFTKIIKNIGINNLFANFVTLIKT